MKVFASWWGIELSADNQEDEALLKQLVARLPKKAHMSYEGGDIVTGEKPQMDFVEHSGFTVTFHR